MSAVSEVFGIDRAATFLALGFPNAIAYLLERLGDECL